MKHHSSISRSTALYTIGVVGFFTALHVALPAYFNSSFLEKFTDEKTVSFIYFIVSVVSILGLLSMHDILRKFGNYKTAIGLIVLQIFIFYGIIFSKSFFVIVPLFITALVITNLIGFTIDVFLEKITDIDHTGGIRGKYMTIYNSAWILAPLIGGILILNGNYKGIYIAAFGLLFPLLYLIRKNFRKFEDPKYPKTSIYQTFKAILSNKDISKIFIINITLQVFYAWMIVYSPIYLNKTIGFSWEEIGIILTIMLIPFVLVQSPLGRLADKKYGEKEIMMLGYIIMGLATICLAFITKKDIVIWASLLFLTRIGAATVEVMIETYFFKKVSAENSEILGMFRVTRPLAYFIAPIITVVGLAYTTNANLFIIIGSLCFLTLLPIITLRDTN